MVIYSQKMAGYLMLRGFILQDIKRNYDNSGRNIFYFKESDELKKSIKQFNENKYKDCLNNYLFI